MALSDIVARIEADTAEETDRIVLDADRQVAEMLAEARREADRRHDGMLAGSVGEAERRSQTIMANARLRSRDELVSAKNALISRALADARARIESLPDDRYAALLAARVAVSARGGETVLVAPADSSRLRSRLPDAIARLSPGLELTWADEPAAIECGVVLQGARVREEVSPASILGARRDELAARCVSVLFGEEDPASGKV